MPCGNLTGSAWRLPAASRSWAAQQSSRLTYSYPAAFMPELTIASAVCSISVSSRSQKNAYQSFQPIGGVGADAGAAVEEEVGADAAGGMAAALPVAGTSPATTISTIRIT